MIDIIKPSLDVDGHLVGGGGVSDIRHPMSMQPPLMIVVMTCMHNNLNWVSTLGV